MRHELEIYFWISFSGLAGNVDVKGLDKVFPESRKLWDGATKVPGLGRIGQNLYHRGHRGSRGGLCGTRDLFRNQLSKLVFTT